MKQTLRSSKSVHFRNLSNNRRELQSVAHESCIERRARQKQRLSDRYRVRETVKTAKTTTTTTTTTWRGAAPQLTGKLELYILDTGRNCTAFPEHQIYLLLIARANNNLCVVSGQKAVSATGNIFSVCFSCHTAPVFVL